MSNGSCTWKYAALPNVCTLEGITYFRDSDTPMSMHSTSPRHTTYTWSPVTMEAASVTSVLIALLVVIIVYLLWTNRRPAYLPPGPLHIPYIGSILSMSDKLLHRLFMKWKDIYGPVFSFSFGNT